MVKKNLYFYVLDFIKKHGRLPKDISKQKAYYYTKQLREDGLIEKDSYGIWQVTSKKEVQKKVHVTQRKTRGHGFVFKVSVPLIKGWKKRRNVYKKLSLHYDPIKNGERMFVLGHKLNIYDSAIIVYFAPSTSFYGKDSEESSYRAMMCCKDVLKRLEKDLNVSLRVGKGWLVQEVRSHYADVNNVCAKYYKSKGIDYLPIKMNGKTWALIDNSMNLFELETILGHGQSKEDINTLQNFLNDLKVNPTTFSESKAEIYDIVKAQAYQIKVLTENVNTLVNYIKENLHK